MRTREMRSVVKLTPKNERVSLLGVPGGETPGGTKKVPRDALLASKYCIDVVLARSTSVKTAPKPLSVAATAPFVPGRENVPSVMWLPIGVKSRKGLKVTKVVA